MSGAQHTSIRLMVRVIADDGMRSACAYSHSRRAPRPGRSSNQPRLIVLQRDADEPRTGDECRGLVSLQRGSA
jgi:hypothetical protein